MIQASSYSYLAHLETVQLFRRTTADACRNWQVAGALKNVIVVIIKPFVSVIKSGNLVTVNNSLSL